MKVLLLVLSLIATPQMGFSAEGTLCGKVTKISAAFKFGVHLTIKDKDGSSTTLAMDYDPVMLSIAQDAFFSLEDVINTCVTWTDKGLDERYVTEISVENP